ncbi:hypothetical protein ES703_38194 [subsurface metagenome]
MNKLFHKGYIWNRGGKDGNPISEKSVLFTPLRNGDISVDRILIMDYLLPSPLLAYRNMMNLVCLWTKD